MKFRHLFALVTFILPAVAFADEGFTDQIMNLVSTAKPSMTEDMAVMSLGKLFGSQITGAPIPGSPIMSEIFQIFNVGVISIVALLLSYTTATTILNTAGEGSFMGQKMQSSYFSTIIRVTFGSAALVPAVGGYSMMQVALMSTILQGSYFADILWQNVVDYTNASIGLKTIPSDFDASASPDYIKQFMTSTSTSQKTNILNFNNMLSSNYNVMLDIYNGMVCHALKNIDVWPKPTIEFDSSGKLDVDGCFTAIVDPAYLNDANFTLRVVQSMASNYDVIYDADTNSYNQTAKDAIFSSLAQQSYMFSTLIESAQVLDHVKNNETTSMSNTYGWMNAGAQYIDLENEAAKETSYKLSIIKFLAQESDGASYGSYKLTRNATDMANDIKGFNKVAINIGPSSLSKDAQNLKKKVSEQVGKIFSGGIPSSSDIKNHKPSVGEAMNPVSSYKPVNDDYKYLIKSSINSWEDGFVNNPDRLFKQPITRITQFGTNLIEYSVLFFQAITADVFSLAITSGAISMVTTSLASLGGVMAQGIGARLSLTGNNTLFSCYGALAPMMIGALPCIIIMIIFFPLMLSAIIGLIVSSIGTAFYVGGTIGTLVGHLLHTMFMISVQNKLMYVSLGTAVAAPLMALGGSIAFYVPYVPVLAYTLATITWLISVIEVMVAVPIIMLGVTYPQGHDLLGKAEQAAMLFFSVFLRPALIVIGYMFSVMTVGVMMIIASVTIHPVMLDLFNKVSAMANISDVTVVIFILMTMIVYAIMLLNSVDYAFGFIFRLPATVMKWIGLPTVEAQEEQYMQEIRQGSSGTASELSNAPGGMISGLQDTAVGLQKKGM